MALHSNSSHQFMYVHAVAKCFSAYKVRIDCPKMFGVLYSSIAEGQRIDNVVSMHASDRP